MTNQDIQDAIDLANSSAVSGFTMYHDARKTGKGCHNKIIDIGVLFAYAKVLEGYNVNSSEDYCLDLFEVQKIVDNVTEVSEKVLERCL